MVSNRALRWSFQARLLPSRNGTHVVPTASLDGPSKLATDALHDKADWPLTARFDEHRPKCNSKFHHACASGEHKRPTAFVFPLPACALREHRNDMRVVPSLLVWAFGEHRRPTALTAPFIPSSLVHSQEQPGPVHTCARLNAPSKLVCCLSRVARLVSNVRASTRTAHDLTIRLIWCGRWASTGDQRARPFFFPSTRTDQSHPSLVYWGQTQPVFFRQLL